MIIAILAPAGVNAREVRGIVIALFGKRHLAQVSNKPVGDDVTVRITMCAGDSPDELPDALRRIADAIHEYLDRTCEIVGEVAGMTHVRCWLAAETGRA